ncbi:ABC transporter permease [Vallitalea guaymasensis]|uniref:ABC transporter permease n=1 Tax=Vallitalea guaymasensis TaxID=1185412 RepID=A0A8J8SEK9_9FIRM|nr:ABC transporter permease [Vallitalea guaymasensis]
MKENLSNEKKGINIAAIAKKLLKDELGLVIILVLLITIFQIQSNYFLVTKNLLNITRQISINLIVAVGMTCVILIGEIDLSVGSMAALVGVVSAYVINITGSIFLGVTAGLLMGATMGLINGLLTVYGKIQSFIVTLAMMQITRGLALLITSGKPISNLKEKFDFFGAGYVGVIPVSSLIAIGIFLIAFMFLNKTKHGIYIKSIGASREAAKLSAISVNLYRVLTFVVSGLMAAVGGIIVTSRLLSAQPTASDGLEMNVIAAVILGGSSLNGGIGTIVGTLLGAVIIGVINNGMNLMGVSAFFQQIIRGLIILIAVLIKSKEK